jgi:hypothetical protein
MMNIEHWNGTSDGIRLLACLKFKDTLVDLHMRESFDTLTTAFSEKKTFSMLSEFTQLKILSILRTMNQNKPVCVYSILDACKHLEILILHQLGCWDTNSNTAVHSKLSLLNVETESLTTNDIACIKQYLPDLKDFIVIARNKLFLDKLSELDSDTMLYLNQLKIFRLEERSYRIVDMHIKDNIWQLLRILKTENYHIELTINDITGGFSTHIGGSGHAIHIDRDMKTVFIKAIWSDEHYMGGKLDRSSIVVYI